MDSEVSNNEEIDKNTSFETSRLTSNTGTNYSSSEDTDEKKNNETRKDIVKRAAEQPDLYCVRRSERQKSDIFGQNKSKSNSSEDSKHKKRFNSDSYDTSEESDMRKSSRLRRPKKKVATRSKRLSYSTSEDNNEKDDDEKDDDDDDDDDESNSSEDENSSEGTESDDKISRANKKSSVRTKRAQKKTSKNKPAIKRRQKTSNISYKEKSEDETDSDDLIEFEPTEAELERETSETIERVIKLRVGKKGATGCKTALYNVEKEGDPNVSFDADSATADEKEVQYLIKWKNWSNIHNTWESQKSLEEQKINGMKRLENFIKREDEIEHWRQYASVEDQEYFGCQQELNNDLYEQYCQVERIISDIPKGDSCDYLVKWQGLAYSDCTQEDGSLIKNKFPEAVARFEERIKNAFLPSKNCRVLKHRPKFEAFELQPSYIGSAKLVLRDYQLEGLNWLLHSWCKYNGAILADEMGLGKTIQTISFLSALMKGHNLYGPFLIVVPLSTLVTWQKEFEAWAPFINATVYIGDINSRSLIRDYEWYQSGTKKLKFNVVLTTYEILLKDKEYLSAIEWAVLAIDEAHRLKNDDSLLYKSLISFNTNHRIFITGTPLQNSLKELWCLLHFIMPKKFDSWEDFEKRHKSADKTGFRHLHRELEPFLLRRVKKDVEKSLPAKVEQILRVEMTKKQKQYYRWILTKNYKALSKGVKSSISGFINLVMELKKCCNHSFLVRSPEEEEATKDRFELMLKSSGKLLLLDKLLIRLKEAGHRVLIFSQMVRMLDIIAEYLQYRHFHFQRLDGTTRGEIRRQSIDHFNAEGSTDFCFLLSTRAGGLGVNLATADTVIIFDSDWNPQNDLQAMARAHRIGQKNQVSIYRLVTRNSVEEDIVERAKKKMVLDHLVIQRMDTTGRTVLHKVGLGTQSSSTTPFNKEELNAILKFGAQELFKESDDEDADLQVDIDDILRLAETRNAEELKENATDELLSKFKVVSFDNLEDQEIEQISANYTNKDWDEIIPEADRKRMEEEEKEEQLRQLKLPPRSRKQVGSDNLLASSKKRVDADEDEDEISEEDSEDGEKTTRRRGRGRESFKGFSDAEIRRFVKSFKKFARPLQRLEDIAQDADLQEKSESDLKSLAQFIYDQSFLAVKENEDKSKSPSNEAKRTVSRPTFKIGNIVINARPIVQSVNELESLAETMDKFSDKKKFELQVHVKNAHFDVDWTKDEDARMLQGVYECGFGNWEAIKMDSTYKLQDKIFPENDMKPQARHLQTRTEYLLKILQKLHHFEKESKIRKGKSKKIKSRETIDDDQISDHSNHENDSNKKSKLKNLAKEKDSKFTKIKKKDADKKKALHFTTSQTVMIQHDSLPDDIRLECKELMRPIKKALKFLKNPTPGANSRETLVKTKINLITIGNHVSSILADYKDPDKIKEWRGYLWTFVSLFTDEIEAIRLYKMYKHALKIQEDDKLKPIPELKVSSKDKREHHHHHHHHTSHHKHDKKQTNNQQVTATDDYSKKSQSKNFINDHSHSNSKMSQGTKHNSSQYSSYNSKPNRSSYDSNERSSNRAINDSNTRLSNHSNNDYSEHSSNRLNSDSRVRSTNRSNDFNDRSFNRPNNDSNRPNHQNSDSASRNDSYQPNYYQRNRNSLRNDEKCSNWNYPNRQHADYLPSPNAFNNSLPFKSFPPISQPAYETNYVHDQDTNQPYFSSSYPHPIPHHPPYHNPGDRKRRYPGEINEQQMPDNNKTNRTANNNINTNYQDL